MPVDPRQCLTRVSLPTAPRQRGSAMQEFHCPLPQRGVALHCKGCTAHEAGEKQESHCPLPPGQ